MNNLNENHLNENINMNNNGFADNLKGKENGLNDGMEQYIYYEIMHILY